ncbi:hypothetical protein VCHC50A2_3215B, partial [Vibrio cholerae HC-50A2]
PLGRGSRNLHISLLLNAVLATLIHLKHRVCLC